MLEVFRKHGATMVSEW